MSLYEKVKSEFIPSQQAVIETFWRRYQAELGKSRENPNSVAARARKLGISRQALDGREKRALNPKKRGRPKKNQL